MSADLDLVLNKIDQMPQADLQVLLERVAKKLGLQNSNGKELSLDEYVGLREELAKELAGMTQWNDKALWKAARNSHLSAKESAKLESLHYKQQIKPLFNLREQNWYKHFAWSEN